MEDDIAIYFSIREKVILRDCVGDKKGVGNLTADRRPIG
jgi:predicted RNA-binding protein